MFLTFISPLSDKTGLNAKSLINPNNPTYYDKASPENESLQNGSLSGPMRVPFSFYQKFWALQKYLHNPILLFSSDDEVDPMFLQKNKEESAAMEEEGEDSSKKAGAKAGAGSAAKFNAFCEVILQTLEILEKDVHEVGNTVHAVKRYPKYFTESALLEKQLKDPQFRKTWLTQVELCIFALKNPIKFVKSQYELNLEDSKLLDDIVTRIEKITQRMYAASNTREKDQKENLAKSRSLHKQLQPFLQKEKHFIVWKENNCQSYEKPPPKDLIDVFGLHEGNLGLNKLDKATNWKTKMTPCGPPSKYMNKTFRYVQENASKYLGYTQFDSSMDFKMLDTEKMQLPEDPVDPSVAYFFDNIISDIKNPPDEEDKIVNDQTYVFRALRVLSRNHIHLFFASKNDLNNEWKVEEITKRMLKVSEGGSGAQTGEKHDNEQMAPKEEQTNEVTEVSGDKEKAKIQRPNRVSSDSKSETNAKTSEKDKTEAGEHLQNGASKDATKETKGSQSNRNNREVRHNGKNQEREKSDERSQNPDERGQEKGNDRDANQDKSRRRSPEEDNSKQSKIPAKKQKDQ